MRKIRIVALSVIVLTLVAMAGAQSYTVTDLGLLPETTLCVPAAINNHGEVVGFCNNNGNSNTARAFFWSAANGMEDLGTLSGDVWSVAKGINNLGEVVGSSVSNSSSHAFIWTASQGMRALAQFSESNSAFGVNDSSEVVGSFSSNDGVNNQAFLWTKTGGVQTLGSLGGASSAVAINNAGQIVGNASTQPYGGDDHAFLWTASGGMQDLGTLAGGTDSTAAAISPSGDVFGGSNTPNNGGEEAYFWSQNTGMHSLNIGPTSSAAAVNSSNEVVGELERYPETAFLWTKDKGSQNLNDLIPQGSGWRLWEAYGINNSGQIAVYGSIGLGSGHAVLLTPVN
jgi:probable HAF family extracellular repeat protein